MAERLALPTDGLAVSKWSDEDDAWMSIYNGIKGVIEEEKKTITVRPEFEKAMNTIEFCSGVNSSVQLKDIFVFPQLHVERSDEFEDKVVNVKDLLRHKHSVIRGDEQSGKTKLASHVFTHLIDEGLPALYVDLNEVGHKKPSSDTFKKIYSEQFFGDFENWIGLDNKTLILDNLSAGPHGVQYVEVAKQFAESVMITTTNDDFNAYFRDDLELSDFTRVKLGTFTHAKQEQLIGKWLSLGRSDEVEHGQIDKLERDINAIVISNKILPRYPFFILSILQTYEAFMPSGIEITSYGHCYYVLILAHLAKSGVGTDDDSINPCINFSTLLAHEIYQKAENGKKLPIEDYRSFVKAYKESFIIKDSLVNRLTAPGGIIRESNGFVWFNLPYSYYFFLGRFFSHNYSQHTDAISAIVERSFDRDNTFTLMFAIHHAQSGEIIDDIMIHTECAVDSVSPSKLDKRETKVLDELMSTIPERIVSSTTVEEARVRERESRDVREDAEQPSELENERADTAKFVNDIYRTQKNIEILSQILKSQSGSLTKDKVTEIIETICDAGLRLVNVLLFDEREIADLTKYVEKRFEESNGHKHTDADKKRNLSKIIRMTIFMWTMTQIEKVVGAICKPELKEVVLDLSARKNTPAYDLITYYFMLDIGETFSSHEVEGLKSLLKKYDVKDFSFLRRVISLRTQHYFNTHRIKAPIQQAATALLGVKK